MQYVHRVSSLSVLLVSYSNNLSTTRLPRAVATGRAVRLSYLFRTATTCQLLACHVLCPQGKQFACLTCFVQQQLVNHSPTMCYVHKASSSPVLLVSYHNNLSTTHLPRAMSTRQAVHLFYLFHTTTTCQPLACHVLCPQGKQFACLTCFIQQQLVNHSPTTCYVHKASSSPVLLVSYSNNLSTTHLPCAMSIRQAVRLSYLFRTATTCQPLTYHVLCP